MEIWKQIKNSRYVVSSNGRVKSRGLIISGSKNQKGYLQVDMRPDGCGYKAIHSIVAEYFLGNRPTIKHQINHIDGNKENNSASNLEYVTASENVIHSVRTGLKNRSKNNLYISRKGKADLLFKKGKTIAQISRELGLSWNQTKSVILGEGVYGREYSAVI